MTLLRPPAFQLPLLRPPVAWRPPEELPSLGGAKRISIDVETRDPDLLTLGPGVRRGAYIVGLALGIDAGPRFYFPIRHEGGGNMDPARVMRWARGELNSYAGEVVGGNLLYDLDFLAHEGVTFDRVHDTSWHDVLVAEPLLDEHKQGKYNLDAVSVEHLGERKVEGHLREIAAAHRWTTDEQIKSNLWRLSGADVGAYGEGDVDLPLRVLPVQLTKLEADGQLPVYDLERELIPNLLAMRRRGVPVNLEKAARAREVLQREFTRWEGEIRRIVGSRIEYNDTGRLGAALAARGLAVGMTAGGRNGRPPPQWQINKEFLEKNQGDALVDAIAACRRVFTLMNTFIDGYCAKHTINGRAHVEFNQVKGDDRGTIARLSSSNFNLQNIPARASEWDDGIDFGGATVVSLIRGIFGPEEGELWQSDDHSQVEYRLLADCAVGGGAKEVRRAYNEDPRTDFHKFCAVMLNVDPEDKVRRKRVKNTNFAKGYGAQAPRLAQTFNCSVEEAEAFIAEYDEKLPFSKATLEEAARWAQKRGYVVTVLGRKQRFPFWVRAYNGRHDFPLRLEAAQAKHGQTVDGVWVPDRLVRAKGYVALNRKLQGSGGDIMKKGMVDARRAGLCGKDALGAFFSTVHDELNSSVPRTRRGFEAARELKHVLENVVKLRVPLLINTERGPDWGSCMAEDDAKMTPEFRKLYWEDAV